MKASSTELRLITLPGKKHACGTRVSSWDINSGYNPLLEGSWRGAAAGHSYAGNLVPAAVNLSFIGVRYLFCHQERESHRGEGLDLGPCISAESPRRVYSLMHGGVLAFPSKDELRRKPPNKAPKPTPGLARCSQGSVVFNAIPGGAHL